MNATPLNLPPEHGGQLRQIASRYGIAVERLLDFSANINPAGPPSSAVAAIRQALEIPSTLAAYPDLELAELKRIIARDAGVQPENIAVANGFVPLLDAAVRSLKIRRCLLPVPSFSEYRNALENADVGVAPYRLAPEAGFAYDIDAILTVLKDRSCDAILLANPQNPSGALCNVAEIHWLIEAVVERHITVLVDEAFIDYCPLASVTRLPMKHTNLIVFRSVTKFFAIPGLRVAYAVIPSSKVKAMNHVIAPWPITSFAANAVCAALQDRDYAEESRIINDRRRLWLTQQLARLKIVAYPSSANFLLLQIPTEICADLVWEKMLVEQQIVLRSCANFEGLEGGHLRVAVRSETDNERLIYGLKCVLSNLTGLSGD